MEIYIDSANIEEIKKANELGILNGVTTNPSLISKEKRKREELLKEICSIVQGPVSAEVLSTTYEEMLVEAKELSRIAPNIVIKIPIIKEGIKTIYKLYDLQINTNATLCFSPLQALLAAKAGAKYISPFIGRLDDISINGMELVSSIKIIYSNYEFSTKILVASIRNPLHILDAARIGADVVTVPYETILKIIDHPLTTIGLNKFLNDAKKGE